MKINSWHRGALIGLATHLLTCFCVAEIVVPEADGSDGVFAPTSDIVVDLGLAASGNWRQSSPVPGNGIYDHQQWAVVFKYTSVHIPENVVVRFKNHPANPPVVWLVSGDVLIEGEINLDGGEGYSVGSPATFSIPGPGGGRGGRGGGQATEPSSGLGPGGGNYLGNEIGAGGAFGQNASEGPTGGMTYGNRKIVPLIGGSGGAGGRHNTILTLNSGGGAGGGAILIASAKSVHIDGGVHATGGVSGYGGDFRSRGSSGSGSGGAIRILCDEFTGEGVITANYGLMRGWNGHFGYEAWGTGTLGSEGRIRVETNNMKFRDLGSPVMSIAPLGKVAQLWPLDTDPTIKLISIDQIPIPEDPHGVLDDFLSTDVQLSSEVSELVFQTNGISKDAEFQVRTVPVAGQVILDAVPQVILDDGNNELTWKVTLELPTGFSAIQIRAISQ